MNLTILAICIFGFNLLFDNAVYSQKVIPKDFQLIMDYPIGKSLSVSDLDSMDEFHREKDGISRIRYANGNVKVEGKFAMRWQFKFFRALPEEEGVFKYYTEKGTIIKEEQYKHGHLLSVKTCASP